MRTAIATHQLLPKGLGLDSFSIEAGRVSISVSSSATGCVCPVYGRSASRVHSRYSRVVSDLPWHGMSVKLRVFARRVFSDGTSCERRIFCERLERVAARARKTDRLEEALLAIVLELGGRAGARLAVELGLVVGRDALLSICPAEVRSSNPLGSTQKYAHLQVKHGRLVETLELDWGLVLQPALQRLFQGALCAVLHRALPARGGEKRSP